MVDKDFYEKTLMANRWVVKIEDKDGNELIDKYLIHHINYSMASTNINMSVYNSKDLNLSKLYEHD